MVRASRHDCGAIALSRIDLLADLRRKARLYRTLMRGSDRRQENHETGLKAANLPLFL